MIAFPFILNSLFNFVVGLLVARFLGPSEYGRYALALSVAVVLQSFGLDWLRLSATRFYSEQDRHNRPEIRATLNLLFAGIAGLAFVAAVGIAFSGLNLPLSPQLVALAIGAAVANGLFEFSAALVRARFLERTYGLLVAARTLLSLCLTVGAAWYFGSAKIALIGVILSALGTVAIGRKRLNDAEAGPRRAERRLALRYAFYAMPIVLANVLYQTVPMVNRGLVSQIHNFAEAGQLALAFEIGIKIVGTIGSAADALLFQMAVLTEKTFGPEAARDQISRNIGLVFAIILPVVAGSWLILPSFEHLIIPASFHGTFRHYFTLMLPAMLCFGLIHYCVGPAFQIANRTLPLILGGLVAVIANALAILLLPASGDASTFAVAQSISSAAGLATAVGLLFTMAPMWPSPRDMLGAIAATAVMLVAVTPLRSFSPGILTLLMEVSAGFVAYMLVVFTLDIGRLRSLLIPMLKAGLPTHLSLASFGKSKTRIG